MREIPCHLLGFAPPLNAPAAWDKLLRVAAPHDGFGRVVDVNGRPVVHAKLRGIQSKWTAESGPEGLFRLPPLRRATGNGIDVAYIEIAAEGYAVRRDIDLWRDAYGEVEPHKGVLELHRIGRLEGHVLGPDGKPLAGAPCRLILKKDIGIQRADR